MNLIAQLEQEEIARLGKTVPEFAPGDTVVVQVKVKEGSRASPGLRRRGHRQAQSRTQFEFHRSQDLVR